MKIDNRVKLRLSSFCKQGSKMKLEKYRQEIDQIDHEIIQLLDQRLELVKQVGAYKRQSNVAVLDQKRESEIMMKIQKGQLNNEQEIMDIYQQIMQITKGMQ